MNECNGTYKYFPAMSFSLNTVKYIKKNKWPPLKEMTSTIRHTQVVFLSKGAGCRLTTVTFW